MLYNCYVIEYKIKEMFYMAKFRSVADYRSELGKKLPQWSVAFHKYLALYKQSKETPTDEQCEKWIEQAQEEHNHLIERLKKHDRHMLARVDNFAKAHPSIPEGNFDELREKIKNHTLVKRAEFYADKGDGALISIIKEENNASKKEMNAIETDNALYVKYTEKVNKISRIIEKGSAVLKKSARCFRKGGAKIRAFPYSKRAFPKRQVSNACKNFTVCLFK
jgi:hypothetical protein